VWVYRSLAMLEEVEEESDQPGSQQAAVVQEAVDAAMRGQEQPP